METEAIEKIHNSLTEIKDGITKTDQNITTLPSTARQILGIETRAALTTADIPLPVGYSGELRALIAQFGVIRNAMFHYPIGMGTSKPPRMGARPQFGSIAMSGAFPEGSP